MGEWNLAGSDILAAAFRAMLAQASAGKIEWPTEIVSNLPISRRLSQMVPFARHSSLPELRNFTEHFQPRSLSLNTKLSNHQLYHLHEAFMGSVPDDAVQMIQAETRAWFAASPKHGPDWLMVTDMSPDMITEDEEPEPFLDLKLGAGTSSNLNVTNLIPDVGNPASRLARFGGSLYTNPAGLLSASAGIGFFASSVQARPASSVGLRAPSATHRSASSSGTRTASSASPVRRASPQARPMKREGAPEVAAPKPDIKPIPKLEIKVEPEASSPKVASSPNGVLLPSKGTRKKRRANRPASKYAVDAGSLSKLIKREP